MQSLRQEKLCYTHKSLEGSAINHEKEKQRSRDSRI